MKASRTYGRSLQKLCQGLQENPWSFDVLAATTALDYYEFMTFTTREGWIHHSQGVARLIKMHGARKFEQYPFQYLLNTSRAILITQALAARERIFLENEDWKRVLRPQNRIVEHIQGLENLYATLPGIAETVQILEFSSTDPEPVADEYEETKRKLSAILDKLEEWYIKWDKQGHLPRQIPGAEGNGITRDADGDLFDVLYEFEDLRTANAFMDYCFIKTTAMEWWHKLHDLSWERGPDHEGAKAVGATDLALDICRSVEYHLRPVHAEAGAFYLPIPMRIAYAQLPTTSREARWLASVLERIADKSGLEMARNILHGVPIRQKRRADGGGYLDSWPATSEKSNIQTSVPST